MGKAIDKILGKRKREEPQAEAKKETPPQAPIPPKVYLKALPLRNLEDVDLIKNEIKSGNILVIRVTPLAKKNIDDVKRAVGELNEFVQLVGGDMARLGEERVVITPPFVRIWRRRSTPEEQVPAPA